MGILRRLCLLINLPLFFVSVVLVIPLFFMYPIYWILTGRDYISDLIDWIEWSAK